MAMSSLPWSRNNRNFICGVCQDVYRSPRFLPCHHTFCLQCIEGLARTHGQRFICPQCRKSVQVPPEGPLGFQVNYYLDEEQLELARKGPGNTICPVHCKDLEPLVFFCNPCDKAICTRCKLTKHEGHDTDDLSTAAERCLEPLQASRQRLEENISILTKKVAQARDDLKDGRQKGEAIKQQVKCQRDALVARIDKVMKDVLKTAKETNQQTEEELADTANSIQKNLDRLMQLRQQVHHALEGADADKVCTEKEMREGAGSMESIKATIDSIPTQTVRPVLQSMELSHLSDDIIRQYIGQPLKAAIKSQQVSESVKPLGQVGKAQHYRRIHSMDTTNNRDIHVNFGGLPSQDASEDSGCSTEKIHPSGKIEMLTTNVAKCNLKEFDETRCFRHEYWHSGRLRFLSKAGKMFRAEYTTDGICTLNGMTISKNVKNTNIVDLTTTRIKSFKADRPVAFDAAVAGKKFVLVEEAQKLTGEKRRKVCMYDLHHNQPVATYTPDNFLPMDVCFWHQRDDKLLIADMNNDSIHVVDTTDNKLRFERYLAHGNGHLIKPTALNIDKEGRVLIGCDNGWVLRCEDIPPDELVEDETMEGASAACGTSRLRVENASSATSRSQASSSMTEDLNVEIASESTEDDMVLD